MIFLNFIFGLALSLNVKAYTAQVKGQSSIRFGVSTPTARRPFEFRQKLKDNAFALKKQVNNLSEPLELLKQANDMGLLKNTVIVSDLDDTLVKFSSMTIRNMMRSPLRIVEGLVRLPFDFLRFGTKIKRYGLWHAGIKGEKNKLAEKDINKKLTQLNNQGIPVIYYTDVPTGNYSLIGNKRKIEDRIDGKPGQLMFPYALDKKNHTRFGIGGALLTKRGVACTNLVNKAKNFVALCDVLKQELFLKSHQFSSSKHEVIRKAFMNKVPLKFKAFFQMLLMSPRKMNIVYLEDKPKHVCESLEVFIKQNMYGFFALHIVR